MASNHQKQVFKKGLQVCHRETNSLQSFGRCMSSFMRSNLGSKGRRRKKR